MSDRNTQLTKEIPEAFKYLKDCSKFIHYRKYRIKHNPKMNISLVLNKNHRKYQFTYGIFRHVYYAIFNQCTKSKSV